MTFVSIERIRRALATAFPFLDISHSSELTYSRFISQHVDDAPIGGIDVKQDLPIDNCEGQELFATTTLCSMTAAKGSVPEDGVHYFVFRPEDDSVF